jgi:hypothetical protein
VNHLVSIWRTLVRITVDENRLVEAQSPYLRWATGRPVENASKFDEENVLAPVAGKFCSERASISNFFDPYHTMHCRYHKNTMRSLDEVARLLIARPGRKGRRQSSAVRSSATRISISVLCGLRGLSLCLSGALP